MFSLLARQRSLVSIMALMFLFASLPLFSPARADLDKGDGELVWSGSSFTEALADNGSFTQTIEVEIQPDSSFGVAHFVDSEDLVADGALTVANKPVGLTCRAVVEDDTHCTIHLDGNANDHAVSDSINDMYLKFEDEAFTTGKKLYSNRTRDDIEVNFIELIVEVPAVGTMNWGETGFIEADADDGSIGNAITVRLDVDDPATEGFMPSPDLVADGMAEIGNLPTGLSCLMSSTFTECTISLEGQATHHDIADSIGNLSIEFLDGAFTGGDASVIENTSRDDLEVTFIEEETEPEPEPEPGTDIVATFVVGETSYFVNGVQNHMDVSPFAESNRAFVPVRYLAYCMGMTEDNVDWNGNNQTATITEGEVSVILQMGNMSMSVNGDPQLMDVSPLARSNRIFLPARFVVEAFGGSVEWNGDTQTVTVNRNM